MKKSLILKAILFTTAILLLIAPVSVFADEAISPVPHSEHIDTTGDGFCDISGCDEKLPCTNHVDVNADNFCDIEGCNTCISHKDSDGNGVCDFCTACVEHTDEDKNKLCDRANCGACIKHVDEDKNKVCDNCKACIKHVDADKDKDCDNCGAATTPNTFGTSEWSKNVLESLKMMGLGMIGIFLVIGLIIIVIYVLNRFINMTEKKDEEQ